MKTKVDTNAILIGGQVKLTVQASFEPEAYSVRWITTPDSLPHFELVEKSKIDSVFSSEKLTGLVQTFTLTSFDSGQWALPSFNIKFTPAKGDSTLNFFSDSPSVIVAFQADTTAVLKDIKAIHEAGKDNMLLYWVAGGAGLMLLIFLFAWLYLSRRKSNPRLSGRSLVPPYRHAMNELEKLMQLNLSEPPEIKIYHSRLAEILKQYLTDKAGTDHGGKTTGDVLIALKDNNVSSEQVLRTSTALRNSDAVKFARFLPSPAGSRANLQSIKEVIEVMEQSDINVKQ